VRQSAAFTKELIMRNNDQDMIRVILARMAMDPGLSERKLASSAGQTRHLYL